MNTHNIKFDDYLNLIGDYVHIHGNKEIKVPIGNDLERPTDFKAGIRYSSEHDYFEMGLDNSMMILSDRSHTSTFVNRDGDSMYGDLEMTSDARVLLTDGATNRPSLSFYNKRDTGMALNASGGLSLVADGTMNGTAAVYIERFGVNDRDQNVIIYGDLHTQEITSEVPLKLDMNEVYIAGTGGYRTARGSNGQRPTTPIAIHRYNTTLGAFEFGFDYQFAGADQTQTNWAQLSPKKNESLWLVRSGDSMYGDLQMTNNAGVRLTDGSATNPSLTFDAVADTGMYRSGANAMSLVARGGMNPTPAITIDRIGTGDRDQNIFIEGDLWADEISFPEGLKLDGNYMWMSGHNGFRVANGTTAQRTTSNISATFRYNNDNNAFEFGFDSNYNTEMDGNWGILSPEKGEGTWLVRAGDSMTGDLQMINSSRVFITNGSMTSPSLAFDVYRNTGLYSNASNHIGIALDNNGASHPVIEAERYGTARQSNKIWLNGDVYSDNYYATTEFNLTTPKAKITSTDGLIIPIGTTAQSTAEMGKIRYNTSYQAYQFFTDDKQIILSGEYGSDTYVRRIGDNMAGTLTMIDDAQIQLTDGTTSVPSLNFTNDSDTGLYRNGENQMSFVVGGTINSTNVMTLQRHGSGDFEQTVYINGNLVVEGGTTSVGTTNLTVEDNTITLNKGGLNTGLSGIEIEGAGSIRGTLRYNLGSGKWTTNGSLITDVPSPLVDTDVTNKKYVNDEDTALRNEYTALIAAERNRAIAEEQRIEGRLDDEIDRATARENHIEGNLNSEITRATTRENQIESNLNSEISRASSEEQRIEGRLDDEITRSTQADANHTTALNDEISRATARENEIEDNLNSEISRSVSVDNTLTQNLSNEVSRATTRENQIESNLNSEITRSTNIDTAHDSRISDLESDVSALQTASQGIVQEFTFNPFITAGSSYTIPAGSVNSLDTNKAIVNTKVIDSQAGSPTQGYYINAEAIFTVAVNGSEILLINESGLDVNTLIVVWIKQ